MPTFVLWVKAELENLDAFWAPEDHCWTLDVKQGGGAEEDRISARGDLPRCLKTNPDPTPYRAPPPATWS